MKLLTKDQKVQNEVFLRQLRRRWLLKRDEVVAKAGALSLSLLEQSLRAAAPEADAAPPSAAELKQRALQALGVHKLYRWVEADVDAKDTAERSREDERRHEAAIAHDGCAPAARGPEYDR